MALFQKKPPISSNVPLYSIGLNKTVLIVGLGNIGPEYKNTRHNIGFECLDYFVESQQLGNWTEKKDLKCHLVSGNINGTRVIAIKPTTFMNLSGEAVQAVKHFYKLNNMEVLVLHDELDINFGQLRVRGEGSDAGNNGIKSLIQHIGPDFNRLRIGVKNELASKMDSAAFVLAKFSKEEQSKLNSLYKETNALAVDFIVSGQLDPHTITWLIE